MAGASAERQENGVIKAIKDAVKKNQGNPITLKAGNVTLIGVMNADKFTGRQVGGAEPYTDVYIETIGVKKMYNLSLKGPSAPSLAGGGLKGLELAVPGLAKKFMLAAAAQLKTDKLNPGDKIPDIYGKINSNDKTLIVVGNKAMGGPIDYMYIGPMDVKPSYDDTKNILTLDGELTEAKKYAKSHDLYFRLRARREDQRYDPDAKDSSGVPKIYGKSPSKGDSAGRIVVTDKVPSNAKIVKV
jgi:hypothetical protein